MAKQKIKTVLIPELGIVLEPRGVQESVVDTDFTRVIAHLVGQSSAGPIMIGATTGGSLRMSMVGQAFESYTVNAGAAPDAYNAGSTYNFVGPQFVTDILVETFGATISFKNQAGVWGANKTLPVGFYSIDIIHYGIKIQNRVALSVAAYEITTYST